MAEKRKRTKKNGGEETRQNRADAMIDPPKPGATEERHSAVATEPPAKKRAPGTVMCANAHHCEVRRRTVTHQGSVAFA